MLSPVEPSRQRNHFKSFCRHISLYESLPVSMREQQRRNWRHGSAAESGVGSASRPPQRSGRTVRKSAVSVKVSADGPGLLTLAVPGNQKTARGGLGGDFFAPPAHGLGRCRADRNPRVGKRVKGLCGLHASCRILTSVYGVRGVRTLMDLTLAMALLEVAKCRLRHLLVVDAHLRK